MELKDKELQKDYSIYAASLFKKNLQLKDAC